MKPIFVVGICVLVYVNLSAIEYISHRWFMHSHESSTHPLLWKLFKIESEAHEAHHRSVRSNMTLDLDNKRDKAAGLFFHYDIGVMYGIILYIVFTLQFKMFKFEISSRNVIILCVAIVFAYSVAWNNLHPLIHDEHTVILPGTKGVTNRYQGTLASFLPQFWVEWIIANHSNHHFQKQNADENKCNYNIILPLFDHIMGTYKSSRCFDNTEFCKTADVVSCDKPKGCFSVDGLKLKVDFSS